MRTAARTPGAKRLQRLSLIAAISVGALAFSGCSVINQQSTAMLVSVSDGVRMDMGHLELRNVLIVSGGVDGPGRVAGTFYNTATAPITLTISGAQGAQTEITVRPGIPLVLDHEGDKAILSTLSAPAGAMEVVQLRQSGAGSETGELNVPVLDGTLQEYKDLVPTAVPTR